MNQTRGATSAAQEVASSHTAKLRSLPHAHAIRHGRREASALIWDFRAETVSPAPSASVLRRRGMIRALLPAAFGTLLYVRGFHVSAAIVLGVAALTLLAALGSPTGAYAALERLFERLVNRIVLLSSWLILRVVFYGVFVPLGALLRSGRRDQLQRWNDVARSSYWSDRRGDHWGDHRGDRRATRVASAERRKPY